MRLTCAFILALLSFVGAAPTKNLIDDLKNAGEETQGLVVKAEIQFTIALADAIVAANTLDELEIKKWREYSDNLKSHNYNRTEEYAHLEPTIADSIFRQQTNRASNGAYRIMSTKLHEQKIQLYQSFENKATEIIRLAKEAGVSDATIDSKYNDFVQAGPIYRDSVFKHFLSYLENQSKNN